VTTLSRRTHTKNNSFFWAGEAGLSRSEGTSTYTRRNGRVLAACAKVRL